MTGITKKTRAKVATAEKKLAKAVVKKAGAVPARDGVINELMQIGRGANNVLSSTGYGFDPISRNRILLEWIYRGSWLGRVAVDVIADDMTRAGVEIHATTPPDDIELIQNELTALKVWDKINDTIKWGRLYGGAIGVYLIDGHDVSTPLRVDRIPKNGFKGVYVLDRWMLEPSLNQLVQALGPHIGLPEFYKVGADAPVFRNKKIHYTRCFRIEGAQLPFNQAVMENLWGTSVYEQLYDRMLAFDSGTMGAAQLLHKAHLRVLKVEGYRDLLATGGQFFAAFMAQIDQIRQLQTSEGLTIIDAKDEYVPHNITISNGISDVLLQLAQQVSGALQIPLVRLLGQSPAGLNSTGESDVRTYYDGIKHQQMRMLQHPMSEILAMVAVSKGVKLPDNFGFEFQSLWQMTDAEKSEINERDTLTSLEAFDRGVIDKPTALREMRSSGRETGRWSNITDGMVKDAENEPAPMPDLSGGPGEPGGDDPIPLKSFGSKSIPKLKAAA